MRVHYLAQPAVQLGRLIDERLTTEPFPTNVVFVSAFVGLQTILRIKDQILALSEAGSSIKFILGIDMGGTSEQCLREILSWQVETKIVKNRIPGHTFHPKMYFFKWENRAEILLGSNNLTDGGFFRNYEGSAHISYDIPEDNEELISAEMELATFLNPTGETVQSLSTDLLATLIARGDVPNEEEARRRRNDTGRAATRREADLPQDPFGAERVESPPPLPADILNGLITGVRERRRRNRPQRTQQTPVADHPTRMGDADDIAPASFYMTLPTLQGDNIPGEARIPLEALELAQEFWGWPTEYTRDEAPRGGAERIYWNWRPVWRVWSVEDPNQVIIQEVRMYMYENSSDFRFYARPIVNAGGDLGDIVRITRIAQNEAEFECVLARRGTPEYSQWLPYCTQQVRNSPRTFGYA